MLRFRGGLCPLGSAARFADAARAFRTTDRHRRAGMDAAGRSVRDLGCVRAYRGTSGLVASRSRFTRRRAAHGRGERPSWPGDVRAVSSRRRATAAFRTFVLPEQIDIEAVAADLRTDCGGDASEAAAAARANQCFMIRKSRFSLFLVSRVSLPPGADRPHAIGRRFRADVTATPLRSRSDTPPAVHNAQSAPELHAQRARR